MAEIHTEFYTADAGSVEVWQVESATARTWKVSRELASGHRWRRVVKSADIGHTYHLTPLAALAAIAEVERNRIKFTKGQLQRHRTTLGMIEAQMRKIPGGDQLIAVADEDPKPATREGKGE